MRNKLEYRKRKRKSLKDFRTENAKVQQNCCWWCGKKFENENCITNDHLMPLSKGGKKYDRYNIVS